MILLRMGMLSGVGPVPDGNSEVAVADFVICSANRWFRPG
jgi:hypothetical protein